MTPFQWPCSKLQDVDAIHGHKYQCQQRHQHCNWYYISSKQLEMSFTITDASLRTCTPFIIIVLTSHVASGRWLHKPSSLACASKCHRFYGQLDFNVVLGSHKCGEIISVMSHLSRRTVSRHLCTWIAVLQPKTKIGLLQTLHGWLTTNWSDKSGAKIFSCIGSYLPKLWWKLW